MQHFVHNSLLSIFIVLGRAKEITISNVEPRLDTNGNIINAHDGIMQQWHEDGNFYWYAMGYAMCSEPKGLNGCADYGPGINDSCGFNWNHTVNLYISPDLSSGSWEFMGNVLPAENRFVAYVRWF